MLSKDSVRGASVPGVTYAPTAVLRPLPRSRTRMSAANATAASGSTMRRTLDAKQNWQNLLVGWPEDGRWHGEIGLWSTFDKEGNLVQEYPAARQFLNKGGGRITGPINIHSVPQGEGFQRRPQDGHWARPPPTFEFNEREHSHWDGFGHPFYPQSGPLRIRMLAPSAQRQATVPFALPLEERKQEAGDSPPVWGVMVLFTLPDGIRRRGIKVFYDLGTGAFMNLGLENEAFASLDPEEPIDLPTPLPQLPPPGPRLPGDPAEWLADCASWRGDGMQLHISEETAGSSGSVELEPLDGLLWRAPHVSAGSRLITAPDGMYGIVPAQLPMTEADVPADGVTLECGGCLTEHSFVRASVSYGGGAGRLSGIRIEEFTRPDT